MRLLLDTHIFLWLATDDRKAKKALRTQAESASDDYVSAASVWEVAINHALGKLDGAPDLLHAAINAFGFHELTIRGEHALPAARLPAIHKDPFDRISIRLPYATHERLKALAQARGVSMNRLFDEWATVALAQHDALTRYTARVERGDEKTGLKLLDKLDRHFSKDTDRK